MSPLAGGPLTRSQHRTSQALARGLPGALAGGVSIRSLRRRSSLASRFFNDSHRDAGCATTTSSAVTMEGTPSRGMSSCSFGVSADTHERTSTWAPSPLPSARGERAGGAAASLPIGVLVRPGAQGIGSVAGSSSRQLEAIHPLGSSAAPRVVTVSVSAASGRSARVLTMRKPT